MLEINKLLQRIIQLQVLIIQRSKVRERLMTIQIDDCNGFQQSKLLEMTAQIVK